MKIKTSELTDAALDWAVATCEGRGCEFEDPRDPWLTRNGIADQPLHSYTPSTDWAQGGPIIERERIGIWDSADESHQGECAAATREWMSMDVESAEFFNSPMPYHGSTPLIAAMRCYVASRLGDEVNVPDELC